MSTGVDPAARGGRTDAIETIYHVALVSLRRALRGKRMLWIAALIVLPLVLSMFVVRKADPRGQEEFFYAELIFYHFGIVVPATALVLATAFPWPECDEGTLTYWFTSPVHRWAVHLGRYIASLVIGLLLLPLCVVAIGGPLDFPVGSPYGEPIRAALTATLLAFPAYLAVFSLLTTLTRRGLIVGVVGILVENSLSVLRGTIQQLTVVHYVRSMLWPAASKVGRNVMEEALGIHEAISPAAAVGVLVAAAVLGLAGALVLVQVLEFRGRHGQSE